MYRRIAAGLFAAVVAASASCGGPAPGPSDALGAAAARAELRAVIEDVAGSTGHVYGARDDRGHTMDTAKIIAIEETGGFAAVYHSWRDGPGVFDVHLATSTNLLAWAWQARLATEASQPTIRAAQDGGYVVAWDVSPPGADGAPVFTYFPTWDDLVAVAPTQTYRVQLSLSPCCEGTVNMYSASSQAVDAGFHFFDDYVIDRQARATMDWSSWTATKQPQLDAKLAALGTGGSIGDRDAIRFRGIDFLLLEGQVVRGDWGAFRVFLVDGPTGTAEQLDIRTRNGARSMSNATVELVELDGRQALVVGVFVQDGTDPEAGQLIYYRTLDGG